MTTTTTSSQLFSNSPRSSFDKSSLTTSTAGISTSLGSSLWSSWAKGIGSAMRGVIGAGSSSASTEFDRSYTTAFSDTSSTQTTTTSWHSPPSSLYQQHHFQNSPPLGDRDTFSSRLDLNSDRVDLGQYAVSVEGERVLAEQLVKMLEMEKRREERGKDEDVEVEKASKMKSRNRREKERENLLAQALESSRNITVAPAIITSTMTIPTSNINFSEPLILVALSSYDLHNCGSETSPTTSPTEDQFVSALQSPFPSPSFEANPIDEASPPSTKEAHTLDLPPHQASFDKVRNTTHPNDETFINIATPPDLSFFISSTSKATVNIPFLPADELESTTSPSFTYAPSTDTPLPQTINRPTTPIPHDFSPIPHPVYPTTSNGLFLPGVRRSTDIDEDEEEWIMRSMRVEVQSGGRGMRDVQGLPLGVGGRWSKFVLSPVWTETEPPETPRAADFDDEDTFHQRQNLPGPELDASDNDSTISAASGHSALLKSHTYFSPSTASTQLYSLDQAPRLDQYFCSQSDPTTSDDQNVEENFLSSTLTAEALEDVPDAVTLVETWRRCISPDQMSDDETSELSIERMVQQESLVSTISNFDQGRNVEISTPIDAEASFYNLSPNLSSVRSSVKVDARKELSSSRSDPGISKADESKDATAGVILEWDEKEILGPFVAIENDTAEPIVTAGPSPPGLQPSKLIQEKESDGREAHTPSSIISDHQPPSDPLSPLPLPHPASVEVDFGGQRAQSKSSSAQPLNPVISNLKDSTATVAPLSTQAPLLKKRRPTRRFSVDGGELSAEVKLKRLERRLTGNSNEAEKDSERFKLAERAKAWEERRQFSEEKRRIEKLIGTRNISEIPSLLNRMAELCRAQPVAGTRARGNKYLLQSLDIDGEQPEAWYLLGKGHESIHEEIRREAHLHPDRNFDYEIEATLDSAVNAYSRATYLDPDEPRYSFRLGNTYALYRPPKIIKAINAYLTILRNEPGGYLGSEALYRLALAHGIIMDPPDLEQAFEFTQDCLSVLHEASHPNWRISPSGPPLLRIQDVEELANTFGLMILEQSGIKKSPELPIGNRSIAARSPASPGRPQSTPSSPLIDVIISKDHGQEPTLPAFDLPTYKSSLSKSFLPLSDSITLSKEQELHEVVLPEKSDGSLRPDFDYHPSVTTNVIELPDLSLKSDDVPPLLKSLVKYRDHGVQTSPITEVIPDQKNQSEHPIMAANFDLARMRAAEAAERRRREERSNRKLAEHMPKLDHVIRSLQEHNKAGQNDLLAMTRASEQASKALAQLESELLLASETRGNSCYQVLSECKKLRKELGALPERLLGSAKLAYYRPRHIDPQTVKPVPPLTSSIRHLQSIRSTLDSSAC